MTTTRSSGEKELPMDTTSLILKKKRDMWTSRITDCQTSVLENSSPSNTHGTPKILPICAKTQARSTTMGILRQTVTSLSSPNREFPASSWFWNYTFSSGCSTRFRSMWVTSYLESVRYKRIAQEVKLHFAIQTLELVKNAKKMLTVRQNMATRMQSTEKKFALRAPANCAMQILTAQLCFQTTLFDKSVSTVAALNAIKMMQLTPKTVRNQTIKK